MSHAIVLCGPPGCGKTNPRRAFGELGFREISGSGILLAIPEAKAIIDSGELVPDGIAIPAFLAHLRPLLGQKLVLDGLVRTEAQARAITELLMAFGYNRTYLVLELEDALCGDRVLGRREEGRADDSKFANRLRYYRHNMPAILKYWAMSDPGRTRTVPVHGSMEFVRIQSIRAVGLSLPRRQEVGA